MKAGRVFMSVLSTVSHPWTPLGMKDKHVANTETRSHYELYTRWVSRLASNSKRPVCLSAFQALEKSHATLCPENWLTSEINRFILGRLAVVTPEFVRQEDQEVKAILGYQVSFKGSPGYVKFVSQSSACANRHSNESSIYTRFHNDTLSL